MIFNTPEVLVKLKANYNNLNPATKKVADYILASPTEVIENNIVDLAAKIDVSQFSIINCIKSIGYKGFKDFKISLAKDLIPEMDNLFENIDKNDDCYSILVKVTRKKIQCLNDTLKLIKDVEFRKVVDIISNTKRIELYAIGYSYFAADNAHMNFRRLGKESVCYRDPHYQKMAASLLSPGDVAIGISTSGRTTSVVRALEIAKKNKAKTVAITANKNSPITRYANATLFTTYSEPMLLKETNSSIVEQVTLVSALTMALAAKDAPHAFLNLSHTASVVDHPK